MEYILETSGLTKRYFKNTAADNISLKIRQGEIYGFIGKNGAGKTTTMRMICGLSCPTSGEVKIFGRNPAKDADISRRVGCLIEAPGFHNNMTAYENLKAKCILAGIKKQGYIEGLLETVGLENAGKKTIKNFSLGMKQRLGIALALVGDPDILLLDEPINGLDPQGIAEIRALILKLNKERNITILISSHILEELVKLATCYGIIHNGKMIREFTHDELMKECTECITLLTDTPEAAAPVIEGAGCTDYKVIDSTTVEIYRESEAIPELTRALVNGGISVMGITSKKESVEEFFFRLTSE